MNSFTIALGKTAKGVVKCLDVKPDAQAAIDLVHKAGEAGDIVEGFTIKDPNRFHYRFNFEPQEPLPVPPAKPKPLTAEQLARRDVLLSLGAELPANPTAQDIDSALVAMQDRLTAPVVDAADGGDDPETDPETDPEGLTLE